MRLVTYGARKGAAIGVRRVVILGTGTAVGKTYFAQRLIEALVSTTQLDVIGIKAIETGFTRPYPTPRDSERRRAKGSPEGAPPAASDAERLERVSRGTPMRPHPVCVFAAPVSPHLAARREHASLRTSTIARAIALHATTIRGWQIVETAGGVFSPLNARETNFDLARRLDPSIWVVIAPDSLGVLHDVRATLLAMRASGRAPDHLVLCAARGIDASTGTNAAELPRVGLPKPIAILGRDGSPGSLGPLVRKLLARRTRS
ncbi:MAG TPA: dethiobiotin synthase [Polyangiaceae bacterium]|nr:dethiobiotin synthase [Polyangiaceae bacterium]